LNKNWKEYKGKRIRLMIEDTDRTVRPRDGIFIDEDETFLWLKMDSITLPKPFLKSTVRRVDLRE